eukprot:11134107-Heterocapsa_arctica.AAC.1
MRNAGSVHPCTRPQSEARPRRTVAPGLPASVRGGQGQGSTTSAAQPSNRARAGRQADTRRGRLYAMSSSPCTAGSPRRGRRPRPATDAAVPHSQDRAGWQAGARRGAV